MAANPAFFIGAPPRNRPSPPASLGQVRPGLYGAAARRIISNALRSGASESVSPRRKGRSALE